MQKNIIRKIYLNKRQELSSSIFKEKSSRLIEDTVSLIDKDRPKCVHCFLPIFAKDEIDTTPIIQYCWDNKISLLVPVSNFNEGTMRNAEFRPDTKTVQKKYNITEPLNPVWIANHNIDMVITPLLAFDAKGYRVGYGKGFYDRFFDSLNKDTKRVGISIFDHCEDIEDLAKHDIPLTHCVTPNKTYFFVE